jgi:hypothetical protein
VSIELGDRVDLSFGFSMTKQAARGPTEIDTSDFEEVTRSSYRDPLRVTAFLNVRVFWDRTNEDRNDRWRFTNNLGKLDTL